MDHMDYCECALGGVKCRAQNLSMGHHTWPHISIVFFYRHSFGCRWWETWDTVWSWRRSRSVSITFYPSSSSSRHMRCSWMTSAPNATNFAKSWWACICINESWVIMSASIIKIYFWISPWTNKHESFAPLYQQYSRTLQFIFIAEIINHNNTYFAYQESSRLISEAAE